MRSPRTRPSSSASISISIFWFPAYCRTWRPSDWSIVNFWCAGCSTGEEPYSLAMVLAEYFGTTRNFNIFATDLSTQALRTAHQRRVSQGSRRIHSVRPSAEIHPDRPRFADRPVPHRAGIAQPRDIRPGQPDRARLAGAGGHEHGVLPQYHDLFRSEDTNANRRQDSGDISRPTDICSSAIPKPWVVSIAELGFVQVKPTVYALRQ